MSNNKTDYTGTIQNLLYSYPLYNYISKEKVNILVFGYSDISERFIDFAFEMAQVNGYKLNITVASDDVNAKNRYLGARPAFCKFFSLDGEKKTTIMVHFRLIQLFLMVLKILFLKYC